jgi:hypothetical protein
LQYNIHEFIFEYNVLIYTIYFYINHLLLFMIKKKRHAVFIGDIRHNLYLYFIGFFPVHTNRGEYVKRLGS